MTNDKQRVTLWDKTFEVSIPHEKISAAIARLAERLNNDYGQGDKGIPVFISVLNGSFMFFAELMQHISFQCEMSFVKLSSYSGTSSTGKVSEVIGLKEDIHNRHVIVVEDIVETGQSIAHMAETLAQRQPASIEIATLLIKPACYGGQVPIKYPVFEIENDFTVGFGMDYDGLGRNLPDIYKLSNEQ